MTTTDTSIIKSSYQAKRLDELKYLPAQYVNPLYKKLNGKYSKSTIRKVVQGKRLNDEIFKAAFELSECRKGLIGALVQKKI